MATVLADAPVEWLEKVQQAHVGCQDHYETFGAKLSIDFHGARQWDGTGVSVT